MKNPQAIYLRIGVTLCALLFGGCTPQAGVSPVLVDSPVETEVRSKELERLRELQAIKGRVRKIGCFGGVRYVDDAAECGEMCPGGGACEYSCIGPGSVSQCAPAFWQDIEDDLYDAEDSNVVDDALESFCESEIQDEACFEFGQSGGCIRDTCAAARLLCQANVALELGSVRTRAMVLPVDLAPDFGNPFNPTSIFEFGIVTTAESAALSELARNKARDSTVLAFDVLRAAAGLASSSECESQHIDDAIGALGNQSAARVLSQTIKEAYDVYHEATQRAVDLNVSFADKQRSNPNLAVAVSRQQTGPALSRVHAANLLVGGAPSLDDAPLPTGLCTTPELSGGGHKAMELFRMTGMCPADLQAIPGEVPPNEAISLNNLINGMGAGAGKPQSGSLVARMIQQRGVDEGYSFFDVHGLTDAHFAEAREYLAQELRAFARDPEATIPPEAMQNPPTNGAPFPVFAATHNLPEQPDPIFYGTVARNAGGEVWTTGNTPYPSVVIADLQNSDNLMDFSDATLGLASQVLSSVISTDATTRAAIDATLGYLIQSGRGDVAGRFRLCRSAAGTDIVSALVLGFRHTEGLLVVRGEAGLDCAVKGTVDGARCALSTVEGNPPLVAFELSENWDTIPAQVGDFSIGARSSASVSPTTVTGRLYLVRPKSSNVAPRPGDYEALSSGIVPEAGNQCVVNPVAPTIAEQAGRILTPSQDWCSHPAVECDGSLFDERIPLEDELSEDSDGVESSWRHYLSLASQAAAEADLLAQEYLQAGLDLDQREETIELREQANEIAALHELERLQSVCGVNIDPAKALALLGSGEDTTDFQSLQVPAICPPTSPDCACNAANSCPTDTVCISGECLGGPLQAIANAAESDPEMAQLARCIGTDRSAYSAVTLGDKNVCYWRDAADPNVLCPSDECAAGEMLDGVCPARKECPFTVNEDGVCGATAGPAGQPIEMTQASLGYFTSNNRVPNINADAISQACGVLRQARANPHPDSLDEIRGLFGASNLLTIKNIFRNASRIGFRALPGNYAELTIDRVPWDGMGSLFTGLATGWPCFEEYSCSNATPQSIQCSVTDCSSIAGRAGAAQRMENAVLTLRLLANVGLDGIELAFPVPFDPLAFPAGTSWTPFAGGVTLRHARESLPIVADMLPVPPDFIRNVYWNNDLWYSEDGVEPVWFNASSLTSVPAVRIGQPMATALKQECDNYHSVFYGLAADSKGTAGEKPSLSGAFCGTIASSLLSYPDYSPPQLSYTIKAYGQGTAEERTLNITRTGVLDALELYCEAHAKSATGELSYCDSSHMTPVSIGSLDDLHAVSKRLVCIGDAIKSSNANSLLMNFPVQATDALKQESRVGAYPALGGSIGQEVSGIRANLIDMNAAGTMIASHINQLAFDVEELRIWLEKPEIEEKIRGANMELNEFGAASQCSLGLMNGFLSGSRDGGMGLVVGAASCINSAVELDILSRISALEGLADELDKELAEVNFQSKFQNRANALAEIASGLATAQERMEQALSRLDGARKEGARALNSAVWLSSQQASQQFNINSVMRRRFNTARVRYEEAHSYAKRMAFLARRAIEARLGMRLESIDEPLPLVEAPSRWVTDVCTTSPISYQAVREPSADSEQESGDFADAFIGRYVSRLEAVVESYRLVNNFHEGQDQSIVSLRDDMFAARAACETRSANLLVKSGELSSSSWQVSGCAVDEEGAELGECVSILPNSDSPDAGKPAPGYLVVFGPAPESNGGTAECGVTCGFNSNTRLSQALELDPGKYVLSWYAKHYGAASNPSGDASVRLLDSDGNEVDALPSAPNPEEVGGGWTRYFSRVQIGEEDGFEAFSVSVVPEGTVAQQVLIAGLMLARDAGDGAPAGYQGTNERGAIMGRACEDSNGDDFRATRWTRDCLLLCSNGFAGDCSEEHAREYCYREASFHIGHVDVEQGRLLREAGFALGNFNYRIEDIALNFVGTDVRDCEQSDLPQTCYSAGFVPYSIIHQGPYYVRNHDGDNFEVPLFTGNIEHARGLATERYLTNPLSDADKGLLADYTRKEFQGRPLDGNFVIRVWEDEGFDFEQIQDVQVVLNYRYWTRFD